MTASAQHAITEALGAVRRGAPGAMDRLVALVYGDLSRIAHRQLRLEGSGHTLCTAALVHEAYLRLVDQARAEWTDRGRFFAVAAHVMRRVLVDHARHHRTIRRGGARARTVSLEALSSADVGRLATDERADALVAMDDALARLAPSTRARHESSSAASSAASRRRRRRRHSA